MGGSQRVLGAALALLISSVMARAGLRVEPSRIDLGRQQQEQSVALEVRLVNDGKDSLEILSVMPDCSCTAAVPGLHHLEPGESTALRVIVETRSYAGRLRRHVSIRTTAGDSLLPIELVVARFRHWDIEPATIVLPPSRRGEQIEARMILKPVGTGPRPLGRITCVPAWMSAELEAPDNGGIPVRLVKTGEAPAGNHTGKVTIETGDPDEPMLQLDVFVPVLSNLRMSPNPVVFPTVKAGQESVREIIISGWTSEAAPRLEILHGRARLLERDGGKLRYELAVTPDKPGPFTQLMRVWDGETLEAEVPAIVRAEPAETAR